MSMWLDERKARLDKLISKADQEFPLLRVVHLDEFLFLNLQNSTWSYMEASAQLGSTEGPYILDGVNKPPNMTPGGLLAVRQETWPEYNALHREMVKTLQSMGLLDKMVEAQLPLCVRVVTPKMAEDPKRLERPYNTFVAHSDIWSGQPTDMLHIWIPIYGDFNRVGIEYSEPEYFPEDCQHKFESYADVMPKTVAEGAKKYDAKIDVGNAYISDGTCLHKTVAAGRGNRGRITLDFRFRLRDGKYSEWHPEYVDIKEWKATGVTRAFVEGRKAIGWADQ